jgi:HEAT repeat protein
MSIAESLARQSRDRKVAKLVKHRDAGGLVAMLGDEERETADAAESALIGMGSGSVDALLAALTSPWQNWHWRIARALAKIDDDRALEPLAQVIDQHDYDLWPARFLAKRRDSRAIPSLLAAVEAETAHPDYGSLHGAQYNYQEVAGLLGKMGDPRAVQPLLGLIAALEGVQSGYVRGSGEAWEDTLGLVRSSGAAALDQPDLVSSSLGQQILGQGKGEDIAAVLKALEDIGTPEAKESVQAYQARHA